MTPAERARLRQLAETFARFPHGIATMRASDLLDLLDALDAAERERDQWQRSSQHNGAEAARLAGERDAAEATVARLRRALGEAAEAICSEYCHGWHHATCQSARAALDPEGTG